MKNILLVFVLFSISFGCTKKKVDSCINDKLINTAAVCTDDYTPVCGCDGITYYNACAARNFHGVMSFTSGACESACEEVTTGDWERGPDFMDAVHIAEAEVRDDCLWIRFNYGGGCGEHDFRLSLQPLFCGTPPVPPAHLMLEHQSYGDLCEALLQKEMEFDLKTLQIPDSSQVRILITDPSYSYNKIFTYSY